MVIIQTPDILLTINNVIVNVVTFIETFGLIIFQLSMVFFAIWVVWAIGNGVRDLVKRKSGSA